MLFLRLSVSALKVYEDSKAIIYIYMYRYSFGVISNNNPVILLLLTSIYPDEVERFTTKAWSNKKLCLS